MSGNATRGAGGRPEVCPLCHGSKGTGGIFGCKCVDNSRLLAKKGEKGEAKRGERGD